MKTSSAQDPSTPRVGRGIKFNIPVFIHSALHHHTPSPKIRPTSIPNEPYKSNERRKNVSVVT